MGEAMEAMTPMLEKYMESVRQQVNAQFAEALKRSQKEPDKKSD